MPGEVAAEVLGMDCPLVEITGGEPLLQKNVSGCRVEQVYATNDLGDALIEIVRQRTLEHQVAIAKRARVSEAVSEELELELAAPELLSEPHAARVSARPPMSAVAAASRLCRLSVTVFRPVVICPGGCPGPSPTLGTPGDPLTHRR